MSHLLAHEGKESSVPAKPAAEAEYSSSSDENFDERFGSEEESSEGEEFTVRVSQSKVMSAIYSTKVDIIHLKNGTLLTFTIMFVTNFTSSKVYQHSYSTWPFLISLCCIQLNKVQSGLNFALTFSLL